MNWGRGLFRLWLVAAIFWGLIVGFWTYLSFQTFLAFARQFGITGSDWVVVLLALAFPIAVTLVVCLIAVWILRGFRV